MYALYSLISVLVDDRFVIKEMVNTWNNIEKESILKFAPKYFDHMRRSEDVCTTNTYHNLLTSHISFE